jgi:hypothetical protein
VLANVSFLTEAVAAAQFEACCAMVHRKQDPIGSINSVKAAGYQSSSMPRATSAEFDDIEEMPPQSIEEAVAFAEQHGDVILSSVAPQEESPRPARMRVSSFGNDMDLAAELPPEWTLKCFQEKVKPVIQEYFVSMVLEDAATQVRELLATCPSPDEFGVLAMRAALDSGADAQRLAVALICELHRSRVLDTSALVRSFEKLFCTWEDISLDAPRAPEALLVMLHGCVCGGAVKQILLTKLPENLLNAGLRDAEPKVAEMFKGVADELKHFKSEATRSLEEYFVALNVGEVDTFLTELNMRAYQHEFVKKAITLSFTQPNLENSREVIQDLFMQLSANGTLSKDDLQWGMTRLLGQLDDITLDCPRAAELAVETCSGMVADELLSVPFLRRCRLLRIGGVTGLKVIDSTQRRTPEYSKRHLTTCEFKRELQTMILEYFNSGDEAEVGRCISELSPLSAAQSAEVIRKIMTLAMERSGSECELALKLIVWLCRQEELDPDAVEAGFDEMYDKMADITLDVPDARDMARSFVVEAKKARVLPVDWEAGAGPPAGSPKMSPSQ